MGVTCGALPTLPGEGRDRDSGPAQYNGALALPPGAPSEKGLIRAGVQAHCPRVLSPTMAGRPALEAIISWAASWAQQWPLLVEAVLWVGGRAPPPAAVTQALPPLPCPCGSYRCHPILSGFLMLPAGRADPVLWSMGDPSLPGPGSWQPGQAAAGMEFPAFLVGRMASESYLLCLWHQLASWSRGHVRE